VGGFVYAALKRRSSTHVKRPHPVPMSATSMGCRLSDKIKSPTQAKYGLEWGTLFLFFRFSLR
jgi:hypothetical protein